MCQTSMNDANDYSLLTANTGIATVSTANPNLTGVGNTATVLTAAANGTTVKSVTIKATMPVSTGMVRLFISSPGGTTTLYKEVSIPTYPQAPAVPMPIPKYRMFEVELAGGLKLQDGYRLLASTQNAEEFNIIAEGLDWKYPSPLPAVCCNFEQDGAETGVGVISVANPNLNGSGAIVSIFTADPTADGSTIKAITIKALQSTHENTLRLFISSDGINWSLMQEVEVPETNQSAFEPSFKQVLNMNFNLQAGYSLGASTDIAESFAITVEGLNWSYPI